MQNQTFPAITWNELTIEESLGQGGGVAVVVRGKWKNAQSRTKNIALKLITTSMCVNKHLNYQQERESLLKEARIIDAITFGKVENGLRLYGVAEGMLPTKIAIELGVFGKANEAAIGIVMEHFEGISLHRLLHPPIGEPQFPLTMETKLHILQQIAIALADMHAVGLVHGDLKPANVLINYQSKPLQVRVIDFGLSTIKESLPHKAFAQSTIVSATGLQGTRLYCAPEMLQRNIEASRSTDMYAFSIAMWETLTRQIPYQSENFRNERELEQAVIRGTRPSLAPLPAETPPSVTELMIRGWDHDRLRRFSSMEAVSILTQALETYASGMCDLFLSHASKNKPFLSFVHRLLCAAGKRVWLDSTDWEGHDVREAMRAGIRKSKVVVVCLNKHFLTRESCIFEVKEAHQQQKPILVLLLEEAVLRMKHEVIEICDLKNKMFVNLSSIATRREWYDGRETVEMRTELSRSLEPFFARLNDIAIEEERSNGSRSRPLNTPSRQGEIDNDQGVIAVRREETPRTPISYHQEVLKGHRSKVTRVILLKDGRIASGSRDGAIKVWNLQKREWSIWNMFSGPCEVTLTGHIFDIYCIIELQDGRLASGGWDKTVKIWSLASGQCEKSLKGHQSDVNCLLELPDQRIVSGSQDHTIKIWNLHSGNCERTLEGHTHSITHLLGLSDGKFVSTESTLLRNSALPVNKINVWNATTGDCERTLQGHRSVVYCLIALQDGRVASGASDIRIWNPHLKRHTFDSLVESCDFTFCDYSGANITCLVELPDRRIASGSNDNTIKVWNLTLGCCEKTLEGHTARVTCLITLRDGRMASGSDDRTIKIWNLDSGQCEITLEGYKCGVNCLLELPDQQIVSSDKLTYGEGSKVVRLWTPKF